MAITNKNEATVGPDGVINAIPTNNSNQIKAVNFHNYFGDLFEWMFPGASAPSGNGGSLVSNGNYELSWEILMPIGGIIPFGGTTAPSGWLLCNGAEYPTATYPDLDSVLGGAFDGAMATTPGFFRVPNLKGRTIVGMGQQDFNINVRQTSTPTYNIGDNGGINIYAQIEAEIAQHDHFINLNTSTDGSHQHGIPNDRNLTPRHIDYSSHEYGGIYGGNSHNTAFAGNHDHSISGNSNNAGSSSPMENRQPYLVLNYIIKT
jgi:microcystin-dependent protein